MKEEPLHASKAEDHNLGLWELAVQLIKGMTHLRKLYILFHASRVLGPPYPTSFEMDRTWELLATIQVEDYHVWLSGPTQWMELPAAYLFPLPFKLQNHYRTRRPNPGRDRCEGCLDCPDWLVEEPDDLQYCYGYGEGDSPGSDLQASI